jgi:two-component system chemotaxis response regulator CheY
MALNVLIVDDSATMRTMVRKALEISGLPIAELHQAGNGQEGLDALASAWIDVVFLDINMPVMNGLAMIDAMRAQAETAQIPVIVVSTESSQTRIEEVRRKGVQFIHKPFTPERVRAVVQEVLGEDVFGDVADASF